MFETDLCYTYKLEKSYKVNEDWKKKKKKQAIPSVYNCQSGKLLFKQGINFFLYFKILISLNLYNAKCIWKDVTDPDQKDILFGILVCVQQR